MYFKGLGKYGEIYVSYQIWTLIQAKVSHLQKKLYGTIFRDLNVLQKSNIINLSTTNNLEDRRRF